MLVIEGQVKKIYIYIIAVSRLLYNTNKQVSSLPSYYIFLLCWTDAKVRKTQFIWIWSCFLLGGRYGRVISKEPLQIAHLYPMSVWKVLKAKTYWMRCNLFHIFIQLSWNRFIPNGYRINHFRQGLQCFDFEAKQLREVVPIFVLPKTTSGFKLTVS